jgi:tetratricopeptide (TPR) repeat protein
LLAAAEFQLYLFRWERRTLEQAINAYHALRRADEHDQADRLVLDVVVGPLNRRGLYRTLLQNWLPRVCQSAQPQTRGEALGQAGKQYLHLGDYDTALQYLKQSLAIQQEIGDKSGEGTTLNNMATAAHARGDYDTALQYLKQSLAIQQEIGDTAGLCASLFNMGHIYLQNEQFQEALSSWATVYRLARPMQLAQVLQALAGLAEQLGLPGGMAFWEELARKIGDGQPAE